MYWSTSPTTYRITMPGITVILRRIKERHSLAQFAQLNHGVARNGPIVTYRIYPIT